MTISLTEKRYMKDKIFLDTNLWVYLYSDDSKKEVIDKLVDEQFLNVIVSTQVYR